MASERPVADTEGAAAMSTHAATAQAVERVMRQGRLIEADLTTIDSEPQTYGLRLPSEDTARYPLTPSAGGDVRHGCSDYYALETAKSGLVPPAFPAPRGTAIGAVICLPPSKNSLTNCPGNGVWDDIIAFLEMTRQHNGSWKGFPKQVHYRILFEQPYSSTA
jgi:hypothetical protein